MKTGEERHRSKDRHHDRSKENDENKDGEKDQKRVTAHHCLSLAHNTL